MASLALSGPKGFSGKGGCYSLLAGMWDMALKYHPREGLCWTRYPGLGVLGLAECLHNVRRLVCAWQCALLLVSLVLLSGCSCDLGKDIGRPQYSWRWLLGGVCTGFRIANSFSFDWLLFELGFCLSMGKTAPFIWRCCFPGLSKWLYLVPNKAMVN